MPRSASFCITFHGKGLEVRNAPDGLFQTIRNIVQRSTVKGVKGVEKYEGAPFIKINGHADYRLIIDGVGKLIACALLCGLKERGWQYVGCGEFDFVYGSSRTIPVTTWFFLKDVGYDLDDIDPMRTTNRQSSLALGQHGNDIRKHKKSCPALFSTALGDMGAGPNQSGNNYDCGSINKPKTSSTSSGNGETTTAAGVVAKQIKSRLRFRSDTVVSSESRREFITSGGTDVNDVDFDVNDDHVWKDDDQVNV